MAYNFRAWRDAVIAARNPLALGPWKPDGWYSPDWHHWRRFAAINLEISETRTSSWITETGPDYTSGPRTRTEIVVTETFIFTATADGGNIWRGDPSEVPDGKSYWHHSSRCAFGEGLYHCGGQVFIAGTAYTTSRQVTTTTPPSGDGSSVVNHDFETTEDDTRTMDYATNPETHPILGLSTFCRMTVGQILDPPGSAFWDTELRFPPPLNPDGEPGAEVYFTDTALAALAAGSWGAGMVLTSGGVSAATGPNAGGVENGDFRQHTYSRSGVLTLSFS